MLSHSYPNKKSLHSIGIIPFIHFSGMSIAVKRVYKYRISSVMTAARNIYDFKDFFQNHLVLEIGVDGRAVLPLNSLFVSQKSCRINEPPDIPAENCCSVVSAIGLAFLSKLIAEYFIFRSLLFSVFGKPCKLFFRLPLGHFPFLDNNIPHPLAKVNSFEHKIVHIFCALFLFIFNIDI